MTGEFKRIDISETPDKDSRKNDISDRSSDSEIPAETLTRG
jgi:hypothetical protein